MKFQKTRGAAGPGISIHKVRARRDFPPSLTSYVSVHSSGLGLSPREKL